MANADRRESDRRYRRKNREAISQRRAVLRRERVNREGHDADRARNRRSAHGANYVEVLALMWDQQGGRCYLCGEEMTREQVTVDHDHACCSPKRSCLACRRGLACRRCNVLIGQVYDDPELLRRIADNLESAAKVARARIAAKPVQFEITPGNRT